MESSATERAAGGSFRQRLGAFMEGRLITNFITGVILFNAVTLGLETSKEVMDAYGPILSAIDDAVLGIFVVELVLKLIAFDYRYFKKGWNLFDFAIVTVALLPTSGPLSVLRSLRILRMFRLLAIVPSMRKVVAALLAAIPGVSSVILLLSLVYYVFSVMVTKLFGAAFSQWFGTVGDSMYSLFQIMTLESWSMGIVRPVMEKYPSAWMVFVPFILLTTFAVLNLFIAVIVNAMNEQTHAEAEAVRDEVHIVAEAETGVLLERLDALHREIGELKGMLRQRPGSV
jgi:voltage-gated sodium channel